MARNRNFLPVQPLGTSLRLALVSKKPVVSGGTRVAEMDSAGHFGSEYHGWVTQLPTGKLVYEAVGGAVQMLDQRKVAAAMGRMDDPPAADGEELAETLRTWRRGGRPDGDYLFDASRAAQLLGMSTRTFEGIEQGRGFRYPRLLHLALKAFG